MSRRDGADETYQALARLIDESGYRTTGSAFAREVYLDCPDDIDRWVTELQLTVTRISAAPAKPQRVK